jgi:hypothetical protein
MIFRGGLNKAKKNPLSWSIFVDDRRLFDALVPETWPQRMLDDALVVSVSFASSTYYTTELLKQQSFNDASEAFTISLLKKRGEIACCISSHAISARADTEAVKWVVHCDNIEGFLVLLLCQPETVLSNDIFVSAVLSEARSIEKWMLLNVSRWCPQPSALDALLLHHSEGLFESGSFLDCVKITPRSLELAENAGNKERRLVGSALARQRWRKVRLSLCVLSLYPLFVTRYYSPSGLGFVRSRERFDEARFGRDREIVEIE